MKQINPKLFTQFTIVGRGWRCNYFSFKAATQAWNHIEEEGCLFLAVRANGSELEIDRKVAIKAVETPQNRREEGKQ